MLKILSFLEIFYFSQSGINGLLKPIYFYNFTC